MTTNKVPLKINFTCTLWDVPHSMGHYRARAVSAPINKFVTASFAADTSRPPYISPASRLIDLVLAKLSFNGKYQITWYSDLSPGIGLGFSSALMVSVARRFLRNWEDQADIAAQVEIFRRAGWNDPCVCAYGRPSVWRFSKDYFELVETLRGLDSTNFLLVKTDRTHDTASQYFDGARANSDLFNQNEVLVDSFLSSLRSKNLAQMGEVLTEVYDIKKSLRSNYVDVKLDKFFREALKYCHGGRLLGSGGGGCFLFVVDCDKRRDLLSLAKWFGYSEIEFDFYYRDD